MTKSVLITGAAGFVGRYVAREFAGMGYGVRGMGWGKFPERSQWGISSWCESDISLETLCEFAGQPDVIVHCAGGSSVGYSMEHPHKDFCMTVDTTSHVLEYIRLHSRESRLVYPSSAAVYGKVNKTPISENTVLNPISPYGRHKVMAESLCQMYAQEYHVAVAVVRLFSIFGEGLRKQLLWDACNKLVAGDLTFSGSGTEVRDWLHVRDAAKLLADAADFAHVNCPTINGASGEGVAVRDVLAVIATCFNLNKHLDFSGKGRAGDPDKYVADISSAEDWGWKPGISLQAGIRSYVEWFREGKT